MNAILNVFSKRRRTLWKHFSTLGKERPKGKYDVIIIGGGHNGLIASAYLAKGGKKVCVLERRHILGGAAVTEEIFPGFKFSRASYVLGLLRPHIYKDLELEKHGLRVHTRNPSSYTPVHESLWKKFSAKSLTLGSDPEKNHQEISKFSVRDALMFPKYEEMLNRYVDCLTPLIESSPPQIVNFLSAGFFGKIIQLPKFKLLLSSANALGADALNFLKLMTGSTAKVLDGWFESEPLKATLVTDSVIGTMMGPHSPGSGYVLLHHVMAEVNGVRGCWGNPIGGMGSVTQSIAMAAREAGVEMHLEQPVKEILLDGDRVAKGVRTVDGDEVLADSILSNATAKVTFLDLLAPGSLPLQFEKEVRNIDYSSPVCKINVALKEIPSFSADPNVSSNAVMPHHQTTIHLNCEDTAFIEDAYLDAKMGKISTKPMIEMTLPSSCDPSIAPEKCHVALLFTQFVPYEFPGGRQWDASVKKDYAEKIFGNIEDYSPGFQASVIDYEVLPPPELESIFGLTGGNIFHGSMSLDQLYFCRPTAFQAGPKTPIKGLYLCGSSSHPGGGVMGTPGYLAAKEVLKN